MADQKAVNGFETTVDVQFHYETDAEDDPEAAVRDAARQLQKDLAKTGVPFVNTDIFQAHAHNDDGGAPSYLVLLDVGLTLRYPNAKTVEGAEEDARGTIKTSLEKLCSRDAIHHEFLGVSSVHAPNLLQDN